MSAPGHRRALARSSAWPGEVHLDPGARSRIAYGSVRAQKPAMLALRQRDLAGRHTRGLKPRLVAARDFPGANARSGPKPSRHGRVRAPPRPARPDGPGRARDEADRERATVPARSAAVASALDGAGHDARLAFAREKHATRARSRPSARLRARPRAIMPRRAVPGLRHLPHADRPRPQGLPPRPALTTA
jgi:hypothetical protein